MKKLTKILIIITLINISLSIAMADEMGNSYVFLERNRAPISWQGEVGVEKYILDEGYRLGLQLLNQNFEKIYPAELNYTHDMMYLQFMNITSEQYDIQLTVYIDGVASGFVCDSSRVDALEFQLPGMAYDIYEVSDFWPDDGREHSIYFHVTYGIDMINNTDDYYMPSCMGYCLTSISDEWMMKDIAEYDDHVISISSIEGATPFGGGTQVFLATPQTKFGGYHIPAVAENEGNASIRIIGTGVPGAYGISVFVNDTIAKTYQFCLGVDDVFMIEEEIPCKYGDKILATIVPIDMETNMASVSVIVDVLNGDE